MKRKHFCTVKRLPSLYLRHNVVHKVQIIPSVIPFNAQNTALNSPLYQLLLLPITATHPSSCSSHILADWCCWSHISADNTKNLACALSAALKSHYQVGRHRYLFIPLGITVHREVPFWRSYNKSLEESESRIKVSCILITDTHMLIKLLALHPCSYQDH